MLLLSFEKESSVPEKAGCEKQLLDFQRLVDAQKYSVNLLDEKKRICNLKLEQISNNIKGLTLMTAVQYENNHSFSSYCIWQNRQKQIARVRF